MPGVNQRALTAIDQAGYLADGFIRPLHGSYCFAGIPGTLRHLLTGQGTLELPADTIPLDSPRAKKVILLLIDGLGWRFFEQFQQRSSFLERILRDGMASKLTTQFPSTTTVHVTTMNTGTPVGEHGLYEWFCYDPVVDGVIAPLPFSLAGYRDRESLRTAGYEASDLFPRQSIYGDLAAEGIKCYVFQPRSTAFSSYSELYFRQATLRPYTTLPEGLTNLASTVRETDGPAYFFFYFADVDTIGHVYGPNTPQMAAEVENCLHLLETALASALAGAVPDGLLLLTADHGHVTIDPASTIYVNQIAPEILPMLCTNRQGQPIVPAGSSRDFFLHIRPEQVEDACALLRSHLDGQATIVTTEQLIADGIFGPNVTDELRRRLGNVLVLPMTEQPIWWHEKGRFEERSRGHHGGMTRNEMETLLLALPLG